MEDNAEEKAIMSHTRKRLMSSFTLKNRTLITPLQLFYLQLEPVVTKKHRIVEYTRKHFFNSLYSQQGTHEEKMTSPRTQV